MHPEETQTHPSETASEAEETFNPITGMDDLLEGSTVVPSFFRGGESESSEEPEPEPPEEDEETQEEEPESRETAPGNFEQVMIDGKLQRVHPSVAQHIRRLQKNQGEESQLRSEVDRLRAKIEGQPPAQAQTPPKNKNELDVQLSQDVMDVVSDFDRLISSNDPDLAGKFSKIMPAMAKQIALSMDSHYRPILREMVQYINDMDADVRGATGSLSSMQLERDIAARVPNGYNPSEVMEAYQIVRTHYLENGSSEEELDSKIGQEFLINKAIEGIGNFKQNGVDNSTEDDDSETGTEQSLDSILSSGSGNVRDLLKTLEARLSRTPSVRRRSQSKAATAAGANAPNRRGPASRQSANDKAYNALFPKRSQRR